ncbi:MAG: DNA adenine methylase [Gammaproteobacteria bacterium]|nr:DNA adenine methylase [Gammaproteobacteria bacterium]
MTDYLHHERCQPLPYYGGKQADGKGKWIAGLLPWRKDSTYVETHGGMMSVLVTRAAVKTEIYNDLDGRVVNYWAMLREETERFCTAVEAMPHARAEFEQAHSTLIDPDASAYDRALAVQIILGQSIMASPNCTSWARAKSHRGRATIWQSERVRTLVDRIRRVQIECRPAIAILDWMQDNQHAVIYCDPPYHSADTSPYLHSQEDLGALSKALLAQSGQVAISGYDGEWDHLGWQRHEKNVAFRGFGRDMAKGAQRRTEVLWTNYDALQLGAAVAQ